MSEDLLVLANSHVMGMEAGEGGVVRVLMNFGIREDFFGSLISFLFLFADEPWALDEQFLVASLYQLLCNILSVSSFQSVVLSCRFFILRVQTSKWLRS